MGGKHQERLRVQSWIPAMRPAFVSANLLLKKKEAAAVVAAAVGEGGR